MGIHDQTPRIFLVISDNSPEMERALHYAAHRAAAIDARVAILHAIEPQEISPWRAVEQSLDAGQMQEARKMLRKHEEKVEQVTGHKPILHIRHGARQEALLQLLTQEPSISLLVLGAGTSKDGPGPLVQFLTSSKGLQQLKIPFTVVPQGYVVGEEI